LGRERIAHGGHAKLQSSDREFNAEHIDNFGDSFGHVHGNDYGHLGQLATNRQCHSGGEWIGWRRWHYAGPSQLGWAVYQARIRYGWHNFHRWHRWRWRSVFSQSVGFDSNLARHTVQFGDAECIECGDRRDGAVTGRAIHDTRDAGDGSEWKSSFADLHGELFGWKQHGDCAKPERLAYAAKLCG